MKSVISSWKLFQIVNFKISIHVYSNAFDILLSTLCKNRKLLLRLWLQLDSNWVRVGVDLFKILNNQAV